VYAIVVNATCVFFILMLSFVILSVLVLSVITLSVVMLSVIMLSVVMHSAVAPKICFKSGLKIILNLFQIELVKFL
jgi:hypothetical protein